MVVTCPNCRSRYAVDPLKIGPAGRTVECARCHHQWHQAVEGQSPAPEVLIRPTTTGASLPAVIPPKPAFPWRRTVAFVVGAVVILAAVAAFVLRDKIPGLMSQEARASAPMQTAMATPATLAPSSRTAAVEAPARPEIEVDPNTSSIDAIDGHFVVRGHLVNNGRAPGSTTLLRLIFRRNEDVLGERSFPMVEGPLPPGGRTTFSQVIDNPPPGTTDIVPAVE